MTQGPPGPHEHDDDGRLPNDPEGEELIAFPTENRRAHREERRSGRGALRFVVLLVALGLIVGAGYFSVTALKGLFNGGGEADDYSGPGADAVSFTVNDGDTGRSIATNLEKAGIVKTPRAFVDACTAEPRCAGIQPGDYALKTQMRSVDVLAVLVEPRNRQNPTVTVREGLWASEIFDQLAKATSHPVSDYEAAAKDADVIALLPPSAKGNVEGFLFPATYEFAAKDSAAIQLKAMIAKSVKVLTDLKVDPATAQRLIIIASLIEAEARLEEDRPKVARVIENRLAAPMRLQLDSTVNYGVKARSITTTDVERADPNPWNTYVQDGLPVGPIANPGEASIRAAAAPAAGPWLYFVAVNPGTGETKFAVTQTEHDANVAEFRAWCNQPENKGKC